MNDEIKHLLRCALADLEGLQIIARTWAGHEDGSITAAGITIKEIKTALNREDKQCQQR